MNTILGYLTIHAENTPIIFVKIVTNKLLM